MSLENPIRTLDAEVARKIAAGEVIDRPNAIVRELMDNAIDSGATNIVVEIYGGGIDKIRIVDNGCGLTKEDLQNCARPHATSKISTESDLLNLSTLGFRGEALASIAAVSRLTIQSGGWRMRASITQDHLIDQIPDTKTTIVQSEGLFENIPARRVFLKRSATEATMCKNTFVEKALARPDIAFKLIIDGQTRLNLSQNQSLKERFVSALGYNEDPALFFTVSNKSDSASSFWSFVAIIGEPAVNRTSKKEINIYVNGRKIQEYSLVQAVEYGSQGFFPNGTYPVASVFIKVDPKSVDFNIHPAKKEVRFYDISDLHHGLSSTIKSFFQQYTYQNFKEEKNTDSIREDNFYFTSRAKVTSPAGMKVSSAGQNHFSGEQYSSGAQAYSAGLSTSSSGAQASSNCQKHISYKFSETASQSMGDFRSKYLGLTSRKDDQAFNSQSLAQQALFSLAENEENPEKAKVKFIGFTLGTFLLAEKNNNLYIIDQHAAHERILFNKLMDSQGQGAKQQLLIPYKLPTESKSQDNQLLKLKDRLGKIGFTLENKSEGLWEVTEVPERWSGSEYELRSLLFVKHVEPEEIIRSIAAMTACKAAIKDGYIIDEKTAIELIEKTFTLEDPHCPHGRPIYTVFSREQLFAMVKRT